MPQVSGDVLAHESVGGLLKPVLFCLALGEQAFTTARGGAQVQLPFAGAFPGPGLLGGAVVGDHAGVGRIGLGAHHPAMGVAFDAARLLDAEFADVGVEKESEFVAAGTGGFHAGVERGGLAALAQPGEQGAVAGSRVVERMVAGFLGLFDGGERDLEGLLGDIDTEDVSGLEWNGFHGICGLPKALWRQSHQRPDSCDSDS